MYCIAGNFCWVQIFAIFIDLLPQINELSWKLMTSLCAYRLVSVWTRRFSTVCLLNGCYKEESTCYYTKHQWTCKRHSKVVEVEISSAESFCSTSQFLARDGSLDTFIIVKVSTQKTRRLLHKLASSLCSSFMASNKTHSPVGLHVHYVNLKTCNLLYTEWLWCQANQWQ